MSTVMPQYEEAVEVLGSVMRQAETDLKQAHAEICRLQGIDPTKHEWPRWTPQANTLRWFKTIRDRFGLEDK